MAPLLCGGVCENKNARAAEKVWARLKGGDNNRTIEKHGTAAIHLPGSCGKKGIPVFI